MTTPTTPTAPRLAALDLGSNSFRLEINQLAHGQLQRVLYLKETVRQGGGIDAHGNLTPEAMQRGWDCLRRFKTHLAHIPPTHIRAVATQTLREARNRATFTQNAHAILGIPIDVITGREEARFIYQGVAHLLPPSDERRLVIDIGGRSTEIILGQGFHAAQLESFPLGSVTWSLHHFPHGQFTPQAFHSASTAACAVLRSGTSLYPRQQWDVAYGASGTVSAVAELLAHHGGTAGTVTHEGLRWLQAQLIQARTADNIALAGIQPDRRAIIGGGLSVLLAVFATLRIDTLHVAQGALRQGVLYDLLTRLHTP